MNINFRPSDTQSFEQKNNKPFFIGVAGGSASGKKEVCQMVMERLEDVTKKGVKCVHIRYRPINFEWRIFIKSCQILKKV